MSRNLFFVYTSTIRTGDPEPFGLLVEAKILLDEVADVVQLLELAPRAGDEFGAKGTPRAAQAITCGHHCQEHKQQSKAQAHC